MPEFNFELEGESMSYFRALVRVEAPNLEIAGRLLRLANDDGLLDGLWREMDGDAVKITDVTVDNPHLRARYERVDLSPYLEKPAPAEVE